MRFVTRLLVASLAATLLTTVGAAAGDETACFGGDDVAVHLRAQHPVIHEGADPEIHGTRTSVDVERAWFHGGITVDIELVAGTATPGEDVRLPQRTFVIPDGDGQVQFPLEIVEDGEDEPGEWFDLRLARVDGAAGTGDTLRIWIPPTSSPVQVSLADPDTSLDEPGFVEGDTTPARDTFRVGLSSPLEDAAEIGWRLDDTSIGGTSVITPTSGTVTIPAGEQYADVELATVPDRLHDARGTVRGFVSLTGHEVLEVDRSSQLPVRWTEDDAATEPASPVWPPECVDPYEGLYDGGEVVRVAGGTREETSVAVSQQRFPDGEQVDEVVVAAGLRDDAWPDALAGAPLAADLHAPLLLVHHDRVPQVVLDEIDRVLVPGGRITVLGGTAAVSRAVEDVLAAGGHRVRRIAGADRVATSIAIARELGTPGHVLVTTGRGFADALAAGPAASSRDGVVLLTEDGGSAAVREYLAAHPDVPATAVGGPAARALPDLEAVVGADRSATSAALAQAFFPDTQTVGIARGDLAVDALAAGPLLAEHAAPLVVTSRWRLHEDIAAIYCDGVDRVRRTFVLGGDQAVSDSVRVAVESRQLGDCSAPLGRPDIDAPDGPRAVPPPGSEEVVELPWSTIPLPERFDAPAFDAPFNPRDEYGGAPGTTEAAQQRPGPVVAQAYVAPSTTVGQPVVLELRWCNVTDAEVLLWSDGSLASVLVDNFGPHGDATMPTGFEVIGPNLRILPRSCRVTPVQWDGISGNADGGHYERPPAQPGRWRFEISMGGANPDGSNGLAAGVLAWFDLVP